MTNLRLCHPHDFTEFFSYDAKSNKFSGAISSVFYEILNVLISVTESQIKNLTLTFQPSRSLDVPPGNSDNNEGCIDALQTNQSDMLLTLVQYPKNAVNVSEGVIVTDTILMIGSAYKKNTEAVKSQVLASFKSFSYSLWALCLLAFLSMLVVLHLRNRMIKSPSVKGRHRYVTLLLVCHLTRLNMISSAGPTRKFIFLCGSLYSLVVVHYFCTLIKTELVTIKDPPVFSSYQDIIDGGALPIFFKGMSHDSQFVSKNAGPEQKKLWKYATDKFGAENLYVDINPISFALIGIAAILGREVIIIDSLLMPFVPASACMVASRDPEKFLEMVKMVTNGVLMNYMKSSGFDEDQIDYLRRYIERYPSIQFDSKPTINIFTSVDSGEKSYPLGIVISEHMNIDMRQAIQRATRRAIEVGLNLKLIKGLVGFNTLERHPLISSAIGKKVKSMHRLQQECESCTIVRPDVEYHALTLGNFRTLFIFIAAVLPILLLVHFLSQHTVSAEKSTRGKTRRPRRRQ